MSTQPSDHGLMIQHRWMINRRCAWQNIADGGMEGGRGGGGRDGGLGISLEGGGGDSDGRTE